MNRPQLLHIHCEYLIQLQMDICDYLTVIKMSAFVIFLTNRTSGDKSYSFWVSYIFQKILLNILIEFGTLSKFRVSEFDTGRNYPLV